LVRQHGCAWIACLAVTVAAGCGDGGVAADGRKHSEGIEAVDAGSANPVSHACRRVGCEIELRHFVTLSDSAHPGLFGRRIFVGTDGTGTFVTTTAAFDRIAVFEPDGTLAGTIGRPGDGPGEFKRAFSPLRGPADSLYVFDMAAGRLTVFTPDRRLARTTRFPAQPTYVLGDGSFVVSGQLRTRDQLGFPLHVLDPDGEFVRSFGTNTPVFRADISRLLDRVGGSGPLGTLWTTPPGRIQIEEWDPTTGELLRSVPSGSVEWFRESAGPGGSPRDTEPDPVITQIWQGSEGFVWIVATVPDAQWAPSRPEAPHGPMTVEDRNRIYDWRIEVFDPATGRSVASRLVSEEIWIRPPHEFFIAPAGVRGDAVLFDLKRAVLLPKEVP
jgi:hypothetical protein